MKTMHLRLRLPFGPLLFSAALLASLSVGFVGVHSLADSRKATVNLAKVRSRNLVNSADQNITAMINRIDHTLLSVVGSIERDLDSGGLDQARMKHILAFEEKHLPEAVVIRVTNSDGTVVLNNHSDSPGASLADLPFFPYLKDHPEAGLSVTKPVQGLFTGKWAVPCARRYNLPDGRFGGIVVAPVPLEHFEEQLGGYDVGPGGLRTVRDMDGGFITRYPAVVKGQTMSVGDTTISSELQSLIRSGVSQETYSSITPYDQTKRTVTFRRMKAAPLIVVAGLAEEDYLAQWYKDRVRTLAMVAVFIAGTWVTAGLLWRSWKARESDEKELRQLIDERNKNEETIKASLREKEVMLREIHHRVKNNMQIISSILNLQSGHIKDEQTLAALRESKNRIDVMSLIHERLYQSNNLARISFQGYIDALVTSLFISYGVRTDLIKSEIHAEGISFEINTAIPCGLIINELVSNCLKHAFPDERTGTVRISLSAAGDDRFTLAISDDGIGLPEGLDYEKSATLGLKLVSALTGQLDGFTELDRGKGTTFRITFPEMKHRTMV
jgi:two-component sensor histidine kinase